jgi:hypothetical protein
MRQWVYDLRRHCRNAGEQSPFFKTWLFSKACG